MTDARNFLINTDYPMDKIVYMTSGSMTVPDGTSDTIPLVAHYLPFTPLPYIIWSNTSDFTVSFTRTDDVTYPSGTYQLYSVSSNANNINIIRFNSTGSSKTIYYRIFCYAPYNANIDSSVPVISSLADNFVMNTDYNYLKLLYEGIITSSTPFTHNLGYIPTVLAWKNHLGTITPVSQATSSTLGGAGVYITTSQLIYDTYVGDEDEIYYRIYLDD